MGELEDTVQGPYTVEQEDQVSDSLGHDSPIFLAKGGKTLGEFSK